MPRRLLPAWAVGVVLVGGCALRGPRVAVRPATVDELLGAITARRAALASLRARAQVRTGLARLWTREAIVVQRPNAVRIDVLSPFGLTLALGTDGTVLWAYPPAEGTRYEGPATPANLARFLGTPVAVGDLAAILLGLPPPHLLRHGQQHGVQQPLLLAIPGIQAREGVGQAQEIGAALHLGF